MLEEHADEWPSVFAEWAQKVIEDTDAGVDNAFSQFVHSETLRCFYSERALHVP